MLVDQPWRVAGRKVATPPASLDRAFADLATTLGDEGWQASSGIPLPRPWILGGRSAGARVACRTAAACGAAAVLALAFPLSPPGRSPAVSRADELQHRMLLIHSADDEFVPVGPSRELSRARPDLVTFEEWHVARHCTEWNTDPQRWESLVREFASG